LIRAFTGPTDLTLHQRRWAAMRMLAVQPIDEVWRSGCAHGIDSIAARLAVAIACDLELFIPNAAHNGTLVYDLARKAEKVVRCPGRSTTSGTYRIRNKMMCAGADRLVAFVWKDEFYRSGEWMTINLARQAGIEVTMLIIPQAGGQK